MESKAFAAQTRPDAADVGHAPQRGRPSLSTRGAARSSSSSPNCRREKQSYWLIVDDGEADLCWVDPGYEVDLMVQGSLRAMTSVWMGFSTMAQEAAQGKLAVEGDPRLARSIQSWLGLSPFARTERRVA